MPLRRNVVAVTLTAGGALGTAVAVLSNMQTIGSYVPASLRPYLVVIPALCFVFALVSLRQSQETRPDGVIYRENIVHRRRITQLEEQLEETSIELADLKETAAQVAELKAAWRGRRLGGEQKAAITGVAREQLRRLWVDYCTKEYGGVDSAPTYCGPPSCRIRLVTIGDDREVLIFRNEIRSALRDGGFGVDSEVWSPAGEWEYEPFVDVTVIGPWNDYDIRPSMTFQASRSSQYPIQSYLANLAQSWTPINAAKAVFPIVIKALESAIAVRFMDHIPRKHDPQHDSAVAIIIIGPSSSE